MAKNWAISIGINQYRFFQPLRYANRDAELMRNFFQGKVGCQKVYFFSDDSPDIDGNPTRPLRTDLLVLFDHMFERPFLRSEAGDSFWFFFSGHGIRYQGIDYLMPMDGHPDRIPETGIQVGYITERLRRCGAENIVLILDACRNDEEGAKGGKGIGQQTAFIANQTGIISIFSCSPGNQSYEVESLQQGAFTYALLEALGTQGQCSTVEQLEQYLTRRMLEISRQYGKPQQKPWVIAEPLGRSHFILMPIYAQEEDIATLKVEAYRAENRQETNLARQLWLRVVAVVGADPDALEALTRLNTINPEVASRRQLAHLYQKAEQQTQMREWQSVLQTFEQIHALDPNYSDPKKLHLWAQQQEHIEMLYRRGQLFLNTQQWREAINVLNDIQGIQHNYKDVSHMLAWAYQQQHIVRSPNQHNSDEIPSLLLQWSACLIWIPFLIVAFFLRLASHSSNSYLEWISPTVNLLGIVGGASDGIAISLTLSSTRLQNQLIWLPFIGSIIGGIIWMIAKNLFWDLDILLFMIIAIVGAMSCHWILISCQQWSQNG